MAVHLSVNNENILEQGLRKVAADQYKDLPKLYTDICAVLSTQMLHEYDDVYGGLGKFEEMGSGENETPNEDNVSELGKVTYTVRDFGKTIYIGKKLFSDNLYKEQVMNTLYKKGLEVARAANAKVETDIANIYNRAFNSSYTGGYDSDTLCATDHTTTSGNTTNQLAVAQDFSVDALEDAIEIARLMETDRGIPVNLQPKKILAYPGDEGAVLTALESQKRPGVANNDVNWITKFGLTAQFNPYLTDTDAWFLLLEDPFENGVKMFWRENLDIWKREKDDALRYKIIFTMRYSYGWTDWRTVIGTPGAS